MQINWRIDQPLRSCQIGKANSLTLHLPLMWYFQCLLCSRLNHDGDVDAHYVDAHWPAALGLVLVTWPSRLAYPLLFLSRRETDWSRKVNDYQSAQCSLSATVHTSIMHHSNCGSKVNIIISNFQCVNCES